MSTEALALPETARRQPVAPAAKWTFGTATGHFVMVLLSVLCMFPVYWMVVTSLRPANATFDTALWPTSASLDNYVYALNAIPMLVMLGNTLLVSAVVTVIQLFTGLLAAYSFARWQSKASRIVYALVALTWLVPFQVVMIPNYLLVAQLGLLDNLVALILPHFASALCIMLLTQSMRSFPKEVIEAAQIDGAGTWRVLWSILTPNMTGTIASLAILIFISTWNEYFWPLLLSRTPENSVVQIGIQMFMTSEGTAWGPLMAASTMASLPILLFYVALQRQVIQSFMKSGLR
ncbi:MAG: carbohydrate ABC transporter permease [Devosia sp.]|nr:carbohydrate ABC transporter permease [Devosia sp.]